ncbi:MAG: hypothetical protein EON87_07910 [Brevundimonas sp.]|nr:MAG: hypothetical protein EON87_07910 [Brevundimonas sp.]
MSLRAAFTALLLLLCATPAAALDLPGFGDSLAEPVGTPLALPEGVEVEIVSYNPFDPDACKEPDAEERPDPHGPEGLVRLCLKFTNSGGPIRVSWPPGLTFISESKNTQNGLLVEGLEMEVEVVVMVSLMADCMNGSRSAPGGGVRYKLGPVTRHPPILEALRLLADKDLSDPLDAATASMVLKPLYLGRPLSNEGRATIEDLPSR